MPKMSFVEVTDRRVSRLHCCIRPQALAESAIRMQVVIEDHSTNGTYVNGVRVQPGESVVMQSGDMVSLVRCVHPWVERCFTFWEDNAALQCTIGLQAALGSTLSLCLLLWTFLDACQFGCVSAAAAEAAEAHMRCFSDPVC